MSRAPRHAWRDEDRQRFADGDRLRASTVPGRLKIPPAVDDWLDLRAEERPPAAVEVCVEVAGDYALDIVDRLQADPVLAERLAQALRVDVNRLDIILTIAAN